MHTVKLHNPKVFAIYAKDVPLSTPGKLPLTVPTSMLADAICAEWNANGKFIKNNMPLTSLAYTAIDQIEHQKERIIESLLVFLDTDTLSFRATNDEALARGQIEHWNPIVNWAGSWLKADWQVTSGIMPVDQSPELHKAVGAYLGSLDSMRLSAACVLASCLSSLALMLAVLEKEITGEKAFHLSRLEEETQAERWGRDDEAEERAQRLKAEICACEQFLGLLVGP